LIGSIGFHKVGKHLLQKKTQAAAENKNILLVFSGSDWCAPCIKLDKTIWQSEFKTNLLKMGDLQADFPKKKPIYCQQN
jgi:thiol-disulfide isomerase/thioredoxin